MIGIIVSGIGYVILSIVLYLAWQACRMYYIFFKYKRYMPSTDFTPVPILGNLPQSYKARTKVYKDKYAEPFMFEYLKIAFQGKKAPMTYVDFRLPEGTINTSDPEFVNELYTSKNKYFSKHDSHKKRFNIWFGEGVLLDKSGPQWHAKRKILSVAFYKEKLVQMLNGIILNSSEKVNQWKEKYGDTGNLMSLNQELSTLMMENVEISVFGTPDAGSIELLINGKNELLSTGNAMRELSTQVFSFQFQPLKILFPFLSDFYFSKQEKNFFENVRRFRAHLGRLIEKRKEEIKQNPTDSKINDFLGILVTDEIYKGKESQMMDECITIMFAATQTTNLLVANLIYFSTQKKQVAHKIIEELKQATGQNQFSNLTGAEWLEILNYQNQDKLSYLSNCINETLRISPSVPNSTPIQLTERVVIKGIPIDSDISLLINMIGLHHNPEQWHEPKQFIPERFDPSSKYFLTPSGNKRHPMSFGPFLGGMRICLGKTFAEKMAKIMVAIILSQLDFEFCDEIFKEKTLQSSLSIQHKFDVRVKVVK